MRIQNVGEGFMMLSLKTTGQVQLNSEEKFESSKFKDFWEEHITYSGQGSVKHLRLVCTEEQVREV